MASPFLRGMLAAGTVVAACFAALLFGTMPSQAACEPPAGTPVVGSGDPTGASWMCPNFNAVQGGAKHAYYNKPGNGGYYAPIHGVIYTHARATRWKL
jgi:hypothetical protein